MDAPEQIIGKLFSLTARGIKFGLEKTRRAASCLGDPHAAYPSLHVAGTNGKGSVCAFLDSMLRAAGAKTGLFTSPHLVRFEERFLINGVPVATEQWMAVYRDVAHLIDELQLTFFEAATIMAFELFKRESVDWAVFETGMGGRLDATNILTPRVSVIAAIGLDHQEFLGPDLLSIAGEKLGIVKQGVPLVLQQPNDEAVLDLARRRCVEAGATCHVVGEGDASEIDAGAGPTSFRYGGQRFTVNLRGAYQVRNALTAIRAMELAGFANHPALAAGIHRAILPGRFQELEISGRRIVLDVAHNPQAIEALCTTLRRRFPGKEICMVTGIMKDKDTAAIVRIISDHATSIIFTRPGVERAEDPRVLAARLPAGWNGKARIISPVAAAVRWAMAYGAGVVVVTGSFFTVGEAFQELGLAPYSPSV